MKGEAQAHKLFVQNLDLSINTINSDGLYFITSKRDDIADASIYTYIDPLAKEYIVSDLNIIFTVRFLDIRNLIGNINQQLRHSTLQSWADLCPWTS